MDTYLSFTPKVHPWIMGFPGRLHRVGKADLYWQIQVELGVLVHHHPLGAFGQKIIVSQTVRDLHVQELRVFANQWNHTKLWSLKNPKTEGMTL